MDSPALKCDYCEKTFSSKTYRSKHTRFVHKRNSKGELMIAKDESYSCNTCSRQFPKKSNLQRHIKIVHNGSSAKIYKCDECDHSFAYKSNLKRHQTLHQSPSAGDPTKKLFKCRCCKYKFSYRKSLKHHERKFHQIGPPAAVVERKCPICLKTFCGNDREIIHTHFQKIHNIPLEFERYNFDTMSDFKNWKYNTEKKTASFYSKTSGTYSKSMVYQCHRTGYFKTKGANIRRLKTSCKINGFCPAFMKVKIEANNVNVLYLPTHIGHKNEFKHKHLFDEERKIIATQLSGKAPDEDILKNSTNTRTITNSVQQVVHPINRKEILNIEHSFNLEEEAIKYPFDPNNIEAWVKDVQTSKDTALLVYKPQGVISLSFPQLEENDFLLIYMTEAQKNVLKKYCQDTICIDGTHGFNNCNFQLYTILTIDDTREGYPTAFMFTNKGNENTLAIFFSVIKNVTGLISCNVFMSDMEVAFYAAWEKTMGPANIRIFCTWHILKAWRLNLNWKIKNKEKRDTVKKMLENLLYELDEETFFKMLEVALGRLFNDGETILFHDYFHNTFVINGRYQSWAYCYRINAGINTNMSLENFNRVLTCCYLRGKKIRKLDKTLCAILHFIKDKLFDLIVEIQKGKLVRKLEHLRKRHKDSYLINSNNVIQLEDKWQVLSANAELYTVKQVRQCKECQLRCNQCNSCLHEFVCSCIDNAIKNNMCKHIHVVARNVNFNNIHPVNDELMQEDGNVETNFVMDFDPIEDTSADEIVSNQMSKGNNQNESFETLHSKLLEDYAELGKCIHEQVTTPQIAEYVIKQIQLIISTVGAMGSTNNEILETASGTNSTSAANVNVDKQRQLFTSNEKENKNCPTITMTEEEINLSWIC